ncbi:class F sortase [Bacillus salacetis]|uniref:Class F sortase n=1 Tax=Bacillus salacetis TaxID=2315464 RepID=A0A3A1QLW4_9BACI|nr:class F sortase [Bacillus salacetis]RIW26839.1 class F sortase [Bacillus salacetis]
MKKRLTVSMIGLAAAGIIGYQAFAREDTGAIPQSPPKMEKAAQMEETKASEIQEAVKPGAHQEEEFVLLDSLQKKKAELESELEIQEEGIIPARIKIPSMDIDTEVISVGLLENGEMAVPEETEITGWYDRGVKAGAEGNAVIAGHVDSQEGPAIFFYLKNMEIGEEVTVSDESGKELTFKVKAKESYKDEEAPIEKIFGPDKERNLNLITCTGTFNHDEHLYPDRLVIYTELVEEQEAEPYPKPESPGSVEYDLGSISWHSVQADDIIGYRIYKQTAPGEDFEHIASVSAHERKNYFDKEAEKGSSYYITSVNIAEKESKKSAVVTAE